MIIIYYISFPVFITIFLKNIIQINKFLFYPFDQIEIDKNLYFYIEIIDFHFPYLSQNFF